MVHADGGEDHHLRFFYNVGGIQSAAKPSFLDHDFCLASDGDQVGDGQLHFKNGGMGMPGRNDG